MDRCQLSWLFKLFNFGVQALLFRLELDQAGRCDLKSAFVSQLVDPAIARYQNVQSSNSTFNFNRSPVGLLSK